MKIIALFAAATFAVGPAGTAAAQSPVVSTENAAPADQAALQAIADYAAEITPIINQASALMTEMVDLSESCLLGFTDPNAYKASKFTIAATSKAIGERIEELRRRVSALRNPPPGPFEARGAELKNYAEKFLLEVSQMKAALDRLPGLVDAADAEGFDAARAVLFRSSANAIRAENAFLLVGQLSAPYSHPEYHLIEAIKNGNVVIADFLDLIQRANAGEKGGLDAAAEKIADHHRAIGISIDAGEALAESMRGSLAAQKPALKDEIDRFIGAYLSAFAVERRVADSLTDYVQIAKEVANGVDAQSFSDRLEAVATSLAPVVADRQAALLAKQQISITLAGKL